MSFVTTVVLGFSLAQSPSFEVATIKPGTPGDGGGRFATMQSAHQFVVRNYSVKYLVAFAYNLPLRLVSGGPDWTGADLYNILAATPGDGRPSVDDQMLMTQNLLKDRFNLAFHREQREMAVYNLTVVKGISPKLNKSAAPPDQAPYLINTVFPGFKVSLPAKNATMKEFASMLQRGVFDRPVLDKTELTGKYDFNLEWTPDDGQFNGNLPHVSPENATLPDFFAAIQQQLGLKLESGRGMVDVIVIDKVERPTEN